MNGNNLNNNNLNNKSSDKTTEFWFKNPHVLLDTSKFFDLWPLEHMTREEKLNAISRFVIYATLIGIFLFKSIKLLITGVITLVILIILYRFLNKNKNSNNKSAKGEKEGFADLQLYEKLKDNFTNPVAQNPMMNILLPEINDNPQRLEAAPSYNKAVEKKINEKTKNFIKSNFNNDESINKKLFDDIGDEFQFEQSMRQFYSTANTRVPNDQQDFARFCYGNMASCKDGDVEMCIKNAPRHINM